MPEGGRAIMELNYRKQGDEVPHTSFRIRENDEWRDMSYEEIFAGRSVVLFALPGAYMHIDPPSRFRNASRRISQQRDRRDLLPLR